jgi:hypothetical protein
MGITDEAEVLLRRLQDKLATVVRQQAWCRAAERERNGHILPQDVDMAWNDVLVEKTRDVTAKCLLAQADDIAAEAIDRMCRLKLTLAMKVRARAFALCTQETVDTETMQKAWDSVVSVGGEETTGLRADALLEESLLPVQLLDLAASKP